MLYHLSIKNMEEVVMRGIICTLLILFGAWTHATEKKPTVAEAQSFMDDVEAELARLGVEASHAAWVNANFITYDTEILTSKATERLLVANMDYAKQATRFDGLELPADLARKFKLLKLTITLPTPSDPKLAEELTQITTRMKGVYGKGRYCREDGTCLSLGELSATLASSRDPEALLEAWQGWRTISPEMRKDFTRYVELANQGARDLGFKDLGDLWTSAYDMPGKDFQAELDRLWTQVKPLYESLHAYVRMKLRQHYGDEVVPKDGPIPAHLLGNMWSQTWSNIYPLVAPASSDPGYDLTAILQERKTDPIQMVKYGEAFFTSLGFEPLPDTFWERSLFTKPQDRDVVCHASAWCLDNIDDLRIKMCIEINDEDFITIHHELGHNFYQRAYNQQPTMFLGSANDGFHEAVGDTLALSITPKYLVDLGFLNEEPDPSKDTGLLLRLALDKVAFLPFGLLIDQWRWKVFSGEVTPESYNQAWWALRLKYQGIAPPVTRSEADFDPGAKYHVPANVPYTRYFLAHVLQFQFHRALAKEAGQTGPLHRASIYGSKKAGERLNTMLEMGLSQPWPDALAALSGETSMDANAVIDYFAPLKAWLDEQIKDQPKGW
ncbi:MAG: M2 family metallopeptidase [Acidobacteria bacterium]|nr:M2 family metallopeptidase [Acidobacteriota bacterium]